MRSTNNSTRISLRNILQQGDKFHVALYNFIIFGYIIPHMIKYIFLPVTNNDLSLINIHEDRLFNITLKR